MARITGLLLLLCVAATPAQAGSPDGDCLSAPSYDCLVTEAVLAAESERDVTERATLFAMLAGAQGSIGRQQDARANLDRALACAPSFSDGWDREYFAALVVWAKAGLGEFEDAEALAAHLDDAYRSAIAYLSLAEGQALNGDRDGALRSLRMAEVAAHRTAVWYSGYVTAFLAVSFAHSGETDKAHQLAQAVYDLDEDETGLVWTLYAYAVAAVAEAIADHPEHSQALIAEIRKRKGDLDSEGDLFGVLSNISLAYAEMGNRKEMLSAMREMDAIDISKIEPIDRVDGFANAAVALEREGM